MTTPCIKCVNLDLKADEKMTCQGFARCKKFPPECYQSVYRDIECKHYRQATEEVIEKRMEWRNERETRQKNRR